MITAPEALLNEYSKFHPVEIDYLNVVRARREMVKGTNRWRGILEKIRPDEFTADFGPVLTAVMVAAGVPLRSPSLQARWDFVESKLDEEGIDLVESQISEEGTDLSQAREEHYRGALKFQTRCLAKGAYRHNVGQRQEYLIPDKRTLLDLPEREETYPSGEPPLMETLPNHLDLLVVDALLVLQRSTDGEIESYLSDYPPLLRKGYDHKITLRISEEVKERLARRPVLALGWHPYCRILGQFRSLEGFENWVDPLLISLRHPTPMSDTLAQDISREWGRLSERSNSADPFRRIFDTESLNAEFENREKLIQNFSEIVERRKASLQEEHVTVDENATIRAITDEALAATPSYSWRGRASDANNLELEQLLQVKRCFEKQMSSKAKSSPVRLPF